MAYKIGKPVTLIGNLPLKIDLPRILVDVATTEEHTGKIRDLQVAGQLLQHVAERSLKLKDPILIDIMIKLSLLIPLNEKE